MPRCTWPKQHLQLATKDDEDAVVLLTEVDRVPRLEYELLHVCRHVCHVCRHVCHVCRHVYRHVYVGSQVVLAVR